MTVVARASGVCFRAEDDHEIEYPDFELSLGDRLLLEAPSGAGKTTLLRMLASLEMPSSGRLTVQTDGIGYAFQEPRLVPHLSSIENICLAIPRTTKGNKRARELLTSLNLAPIADRRADALSGGEAHRVNLTRALIAEPDILLLDEVGAGLDQHSWDLARKLVQSCADAKPMSIVEVSHNPERRLADFDKHVTLQF